MCMNITGNSATIVQYPYTPGATAYAAAPSSPAGNEVWLIHPFPGGYEIQAANDTALCLNIKGGFGQGHAIILYECTGAANEQFVPDQP